MALQPANAIIGYTFVESGCLLPRPSKDPGVERHAPATRVKMLDRPSIADGDIIAQIKSQFGVDACTLEFLPVGNDARAWCFRLRSRGGDYFLKLRKGLPKTASLLVPRFLQRSGIPQVVAPIAARSGDLCARWSEFSLILYPYVEGMSAWGMALSAPQWQAWGELMRAIHDARCDRQLLDAIPHEVFGVKWIDSIAEIESVLAERAYVGEVATGVAQLWRDNTREIETARDRYLSLGAHLADRPPQYLLCHADIHTANIIIDERGLIHIVDWDETILAPKERDLMFFLGDGHAPEHETAFRRGYGESKVNRLALAYFRYDWVMQELADYGQRVFLASDLGAQDLALALVAFERLFAPGDVVERARQAYARIGKGELNAGLT